MTRVTSRPLGVERCPDGRRMLLRDLEVNVGAKCSKACMVTVRKGFVTDYSSLPFGTRWVVHWSRVDVASVVHDYMYRNDAVLPSPDWNRRRIDRAWRTIALAGDRHANCIQAWTCWLAMRVFAFCAFHKRSTDWNPCKTPEPAPATDPEESAWRLVGLVLLAALLRACADWNAIKASWHAIKASWHVLGCTALLVLTVAIGVIVLCGWSRRLKERK